MYKGYVIEPLSNNFAKQHARKGQNLVEEEGRNIIRDLESYTGKDGMLDAALLTDNWFPKVKADVFISHSHLNDDLALRLAGWLDEEFGLKAFVDSLIWDSADKLLKQIDKNYCLNDDKRTYNYKERNLSTSHVHMMLAMSIAHMIDNCECLFFLRTPSSVSPKETIKDQDKTSSPWIFTEIVLSRLIRQRPLPNDRQKHMVNASKSLSMESMKINHPLDIAHLTKIGENEFSNWQRDFLRAKKKHPLDVLYHLRL